MKRALPVAAGLIIVTAAVLLIVAWREIADLRGEVTRLRSERETQKDSSRTPAVSKSSQPSSKRDTIAGKPAAPEGGTKESAKEKEDAMDLLLGAGKKEVAQRSEARLTLLTGRLKLRPDQVEALKKHAAGRADEILASFGRLRSDTARPPDLGVLIDWSSGRFDLPVSDILDPAQAELFKEFATNEREGRIENLVNMELLEMQSEAGIQLTPEQKDQVFEKISEITLAEDAMGDAYYMDDAGFESRIEESLRRRREALRPILDESQMQNYERALTADGALIAQKFPSSAKAAGRDAKNP